MDNNTLVFVATALGCLLSFVAVQRLLFYTKSEIDNRINSALQECRTELTNFKKQSDDEDKKVADDLYESIGKLKEDHSHTKDKIYEKLLDAERQTNQLSKDIYDKLSHSKQIFEDYNKQILQTISELKQDEKEVLVNLGATVNSVKDELKTDYINRYNELLKLINTKVSASDFDRLENKFDKVSETITELKTIVQMRMDKDAQ